MIKTLRFFQVLMLVLWLGGMFFFGAILAPSAFQSLPNQRIAGNLVSLTLGRLSLLSGVALAIFFGLALLRSQLEKRVLTRGRRWMMVGVVLAFALVLYLRYGIDARMHELRMTGNGIESLAPDDPHRLEFDRLHRRSTALFGLEFIAGLFVLRQFVVEE
ncbi:MAG: DUF4149 domain-containing protein [Acidobacteriia bacterium]|nr:DUF4149 domain-containing protein [Terriglobia bacterium]